MKRHFASDNNAGVHPEVLQAIAAANQDHAPAYGSDEITARVESLFERLFGEGARTFLVFGGTAANVLPLRHLTKPWEGVVCTTNAHINVDECAAIESVAGRKLIPIAGVAGKLTPDMIRHTLTGRLDQHRVQPRVVSVSQATELGTVYSLDELRAVCDAAHENGMLVHMDGARISNAAVALGVDFQSMTRSVGVDVVSFGGTKNGLMGADAVVFLRPELGDGFEFARKQMLQLGSKMRFLAAQFVALLEDDLWTRSARHANAMAARLAGAVREIQGVTITEEVQTNAVFATLPQSAITRLQEVYRFGVWNAPAFEVRWMTSFDTTEEDVDRFAEAVAAAVR